MSKSPERNRLDSALDLASRGIPVFPFELIGHRKRPVVKDWYNAASTDPKVIKAWFGNGSNYLIGVPTGKRSGLAVLDADPQHGGDQWVDDHIDNLPTTRTHTTLRSGQHYFMQWREGLRGSQSKVGQGIDILGEGNFVAWWPAEGLPVINADTIADWPDWLAELAMAGRPAGGGGEVPLAKRLPPSAAAVAELIDRMENRLETTRDTYVALNTAAKGCIDALAEVGKLTPDEEVAIAEAAITWSERWPLHDGRTDERLKWLDDWSHRDAKLAGWQTLQHVATELINGYGDEIAANEFHQASPPPPSAAKNRFALVRYDEILTMAEPEWLIPGVLTQNTFAVLYAPYDSFKSFIAADWALCLATGTPWCGQPVKRCDAVYVVGEAVSGTRLRLEAWVKQHGIEARGFAIVPLAPNLMFPEQVKEFIRAILDERRANGFDPGLVVIDTLHRSMAGGDENSAKDMSVVIASIAAIQREIGCTVVLIHHAGKDVDRGSRGSSAVPADTDSLLTVTRHPGTMTCTLRVERHKDADSGQVFPLRLVKVELPVNPKTLESRSSLVVTLDTQPTIPLSDIELRALRVLVELVEAEGVIVEPHGRVVQVIRWEMVCEDRQLSTAADRKNRNQAFRRAVQKLVDAGKIVVKGDLVRSTGDGGIL
jgi:hypothetical protein